MRESHQTTVFCPNLVFIAWFTCLHTIVYTHAHILFPLRVVPARARLSLLCPSLPVALFGSCRFQESFCGMNESRKVLDVTALQDTQEY